MLSLLIILKQVIYLVNFCFIICNTYLSSFEKFNFYFLPKIYLKIALGAEQNEERSDSDPLLTIEPDEDGMYHIGDMVIDEQEYKAMYLETGQRSESQDFLWPNGDIPFE